MVGFLQSPYSIELGPPTSLLSKVLKEWKKIWNLYFIFSKAIMKLFMVARKNELGTLVVVCVYVFFFVAQSSFKYVVNVNILSLAYCFSFLVPHIIL